MRFSANIDAQDAGPLPDDACGDAGASDSNGVPIIGEPSGSATADPSRLPAQNLRSTCLSPACTARFRSALAAVPPPSTAPHTGGRWLRVSCQATWSPGP